MGLLLTYSSVLSTTFNSPLATSVTGNVKVRSPAGGGRVAAACSPLLAPVHTSSLQDVFVTAAGWALFGGMAVTPKSILGLCGTFVGAFAYSVISLRKQQQISADAFAAQGQQQRPQPQSVFPLSPTVTIAAAASGRWALSEPSVSAGQSPAAGAAAGEDGDGGATAVPVEMPVALAVDRRGEGESGTASRRQLQEAEAVGFRVAA